MADYVPPFVSADHWTATTSTAVVGQQLLAVTGSNTVGTGGAGSPVVGVAAFDAPIGTKVTVHSLSGLIHNLIANAAITAGQTLKAAANGQITPWVSGTDAADLAIAIALSTQATAGSPVRVIGIR